MYIYNSKYIKKTQIYKLFLWVFLLLYIYHPQNIFAQNTNTENDCSIDIWTTSIVPNSKIQDYWIINNNDILAIYNNLQKICEWNQNQESWPTEKSYTIQMYKNTIKDKFLLWNNDYTTEIQSPITPDLLAQKRYDKKISYYKDNKWQNPELLKSEFNEIRKYWIYTYSINPGNCTYSWDKTKWIYDKLYNLCDMTKCMRDKIVVKNTDANVLASEYTYCKAYVDDIINNELDRVQEMITKYSTKMTNSNFDTYINKYIWFRMTNVQIVQDKIDWYMNFLLKKITKFTKNCMS